MLFALWKHNYEEANNLCGLFDSKEKATEGLKKVKPLYNDLKIHNKSWYTIEEFEINKVELIDKDSKLCQPVVFENLEEKVKEAQEFLENARESKSILKRRYPSSRFRYDSDDLDGLEKNIEDTQKTFPKTQNV